MASHPDSAETDTFRLAVMHAALDLFEDRGYESTTVDQIADRAGISRRTFFRQFGSKEDVVFVDHDITLTSVQQFLEMTELGVEEAVCEAAVRVYARFAGTPESTRRRYRVMQTVPALREREIVMILRYERVFADVLRRSADADPLRSVQFAAAITATHNYLLRTWLRGADTEIGDVRAALSEVRRRFTSDPSSGRPTVAILPPGTSVAEVTALLSRHLGGVEQP